MNKTAVLIFNLNVGGGFVNFSDEQPAGPTFVLSIDLGEQGRITALAETVYRDPSGIAVRFLELDTEAADRVGRTVDRVRHQNHA